MAGTENPSHPSHGITAMYHQEEKRPGKKSSILVLEKGKLAGPAASKGKTHIIPQATGEAHDRHHPLPESWRRGHVRSLVGLALAVQATDTFLPTWSNRHRTRRISQAYERFEIREQPLKWYGIDRLRRTSIGVVRGLTLYLGSWILISAFTSCLPGMLEL